MNRIIGTLTLYVRGTRGEDFRLISGPIYAPDEGGNGSAHCTITGHAEHEGEPGVMMIKANDGEIVCGGGLPRGSGKIYALGEKVAWGYVVHPSDVQRLVAVADIVEEHDAERCGAGDCTNRRIENSQLCARHFNGNGVTLTAPKAGSALKHPLDVIRALVGTHDVCVVSVDQDRGQVYIRTKGAVSLPLGNLVADTLPVTIAVEWERACWASECTRKRDGTRKHGLCPECEASGFARPAGDAPRAKPRIGQTWVRTTGEEPRQRAHLLVGAEPADCPRFMARVDGEIGPMREASIKKNWTYLEGPTHPVTPREELQAQAEWEMRSPPSWLTPEQWDRSIMKACERDSSHEPLAEELREACANARALTARPPECRLVSVKYGRSRGEWREDAWDWGEPDALPAFSGVRSR